MVDAIRITGLNEFVRGLKRLDNDLPKVLRVAFNKAADVIVTEARGGVRSRTGAAKASIKARSTQREVRIVGGSKRVPYYPWLDFGGRVGPKKSIRRPFLKDGRYIYASYFKHRGQLAGQIEAALIDAARAAGVEVD